MKNAFVDANGVLTSWGYAESNGGDTLVEVPDDFAMTPGAAQYKDGEWSAYTPPLSLAPEARTALDSSDVTVLRCVEHGVPVPAEWAAYRAALRAIVSGASLATTLPERPAFPAGT